MVLIMIVLYDSKRRKSVTPQNGCTLIPHDQLQKVFKFACRWAIDNQDTLSKVNDVQKYTSKHKHLARKITFSKMIYLCENNQS